MWTKRVMYFRNVYEHKFEFFLVTCRIHPIQCGKQKITTTTSYTVSLSPTPLHKLSVFEKKKMNRIELTER